MTPPGSPFAGGLRVARLVGGLLSAQTLAQVLTLLSGFLLLRWLSVEEDAQYTITFGFIATLSGLVDLGIAAAVMPLVGDRARDARVVGHSSPGCRCSLSAVCSAGSLTPSTEPTVSPPRKHRPAAGPLRMRCPSSGRPSRFSVS